MRTLTIAFILLPSLWFVSLSALAATSPEDRARKAESRLLVEHAERLIRVGELQDALGLIDEAKATYPRFAPAHYQQGVIFRHLGLYEAAKRSLSRAIDLNPKLHGPWWERCRIHRILGDLESAVFDCTAAVARSPKPAITRYLAKSYTELGRPEQAIATLKNGMTQSSSGFEFITDLQALAHAQDAWGELETWLREMTSRSPRPAKWLLLHAELFTQHRESERTQQLRQRALKISKRLARKRPSSINLYWRAQSYRALGRTHQAVMDAKAALKRSPENQAIKRLVHQLRQSSHQS